MSSSEAHSSVWISQEKKTDVLIRKYYKITQPSPVLREILDSPAEAAIVSSALKRQVSLIKCRSQNPDDGQTTIYDRALLVLTKYGAETTDPGALELYFTEYLGILPFNAFSQGKKIVNEHVQLQGLVWKASASAKRMGYTGTAEAGTKTEEPSTSTIGEARDDPDDYSPPFKLATDENPNTQAPPQLRVRVERLLETFRAAKDDYYTALEQEGMVSIGAARFLRDSAENALNYLRNNNMGDHDEIEVLEYTFAVARDKATELLGGRKRHFDEGDRRGGTKRHRPQHNRRFVDSYRPMKRG